MPVSTTGMIPRLPAATPAMIAGKQPTSVAGPSTGVPPHAPGTYPPIQDRTPEQLKDGMFVKVNGAGSDDIAAARLIQDGAEFVARQASTTVGLKTVDINDKSIDNAGALGMATFHGNDGWFGLSVRSTGGIMEGLKLLRTTPFGSWTEGQRSDFLQANETILHEAGHVTLSGYGSGDVGAWRGANRSFEEGLTEVATMANIDAFMKEEYGIVVPPQSERIQQSVSAYTRYTERIRRVLAMGTDGTPAQIGVAATAVSDSVPADKRLPEMARRLATNLGPAAPPQQIIDDIAATLPGFVEEKNGTRTHLMQLQAALVDLKAGVPVDTSALHDEIQRAVRKLAPSPVNGTTPIE